MSLFFVVVMQIYFSQAQEIPKAEGDTPVSITDTSEYLPMLDVVYKIPETSWGTLKTAFSKDSLPQWGVIIGSTALLYHYDEKIYSEIQQQGRHWGIGNGDNTKAAFQLGPYDVRFPTDTGSGMYFLGDGITHSTIAASFIGFGYLAESPRAYNTGLEIVHGMVVSTIFNQALKRSFGRQSPIRKTKNRGEWRPFPSFKKYADDTAAYDAMPSGHIMTATMTFTVILENYPEHAYWIRPLEITWLTLLGWQMVNNGVHWASDYPLGIAMGYLYGKAAARLGQKKTDVEEKPGDVSWIVTPSFENGVAMTNLYMSF